MVDDFLATARALAVAKKWAVLDTFFALTQANLDHDASGVRTAGSAISALDVEVKDASHTLSEAAAKLATGSG